MKNVLIGVLVIIIIVLGYLQFKPKIDVTPSEQTTARTDPSGKDYRPGSPTFLASHCGLTINSLTQHAPNNINYTVKINGTIDNRNANDCTWSKFEGYGGSARLYYKSVNVHNSVAIWTPIGDNVPTKLSNNWINDPTSFTLEISFDNSKYGLSDGTEMKAVFTEEDAKGDGQADSLEVPFSLAI